MRRKNGNHKVVERLKKEKLVREVVWGSKRFVFVDWFLHYLYLMALLRDQNLYRRISLRSSNLKKYYSRKGLSTPKGYMLSVVEDFSLSPPSKKRAKLMKKVVSLLKNREVKVILRKTRNRVLLYRFLHSLALRITEKNRGGILGFLKGLVGRIALRRKKEKLEARQTEVFRLDGFSPPLHRVCVYGL